MTRKSGNLRGTAPPKPMRGTKQTGNDARQMAPVAIATKRTGLAPRMVNRPSGVIEIAHRSFLCPITSANAFTASGFYVNPGLPGTFPWLAKLARRYEEYRFKKLRFEYRSVCATSTSGVVMMSFDYDAADALPTSKPQQAQTVPNSEINSWASNDLMIACDAGWKYIRAGTLSANLDVKTYDLGQMCLSTVYGTGVVTGELYVEYAVELRKPTDGATTSGSLTSQTAVLTAPFGGVNAFVGFFPFTYTDNNTLTVAVPGEYFCVFTTTGTGLTAAAATPTIVTTGSGVVTSLTSSASATIGNRVFRVRCELGDVLTFANAGTGTTVTLTVLRVGTADYVSVA